MAGFTVSSALCGFSQTALQLVIFRVIQGAFAALMSPQVLATIQVTFAGHERDKATGFVGATVGVGSFLGNVLGGWLVGANLWGLEWRPIFFVNVPIGIIAIALSHFYVKESKSAGAQKLDIPGALDLRIRLVSADFSHRRRPRKLLAVVDVGDDRGRDCCVLALRSIREIARQTRRRALNFARTISIGRLRARIGRDSVVVFRLELVFVCARAVSSTRLNVSTQHTGTIFAALSLSFLISSIGAVKVVRRIGQKTLLVGLFIMQIGQLMLIAVPLLYKGNFNPNWLMPILFFYGLGQGLSVPQVIRQTLNHVGNANAGAASGVLNTTQQIAFSLGVSVVGGVFFAFADQGETPESFARGVAAAFAMNFVFVFIALVLIARISN
jgi:MFS family permease